MKGMKGSTYANFGFGSEDMMVTKYKRCQTSQRFSLTKVRVAHPTSRSDFQIGTGSFCVSETHLKPMKYLLF